MNCLWFKPAQAAIDKIKQTVTYGYDINDLIYGYKNVVKQIPEFKEKVINTFNIFKPNETNKTKKTNTNSKTTTTKTSNNKTNDNSTTKTTNAPNKMIKNDTNSNDVKQTSSAVSFIMPIKGTITSGFGNRINPVTKKKEYHEGVDIAASIGTKVCAISDGTIVITREDSSYGKYIKIKHEGGIYSLYAHLKDIYVKQGQIIKKGTVIGDVGITGETDGPHLHFEIIKDGKNINPLSIFGVGNI